MRVIDCMRVKYPDIQWHYCMTKQRWEGSDGSVVSRTFHTHDLDGENGELCELWRYFNHRENRAPEYIGIEFKGTA